MGKTEALSYPKARQKARQGKPCPMEHGCCDGSFPDQEQAFLLFTRNSRTPPRRRPSAHAPGRCPRKRLRAAGRPGYSSAPLLFSRLSCPSVCGFPAPHACCAVVRTRGKPAPCPAMQMKKRLLSGRRPLLPFSKNRRIQKQAFRTRSWKQFCIKMWGGSFFLLCRASFAFRKD